MGTTWAVSLVVPPGLNVTAVQGSIEQALDIVVAQMSTWRDDSDISWFNCAPAGATVAIVEPFYSVLVRACEIAELTAGAYDPTVGASVDVWGFGPHPASGAPPADATAADAAGRIGWRRLQLDRAARTITQPGGVALDLSAIAKGFAVDAVAKVVSRYSQSALVDIGGELRGTGLKPNGDPWWVSLDWPDQREPDAPIVFGLCDISIASSGDYRRYFEHNGRRYPHTIDPRTGRPIEHGVASVTVVHEECMTADALSTALTVLGVEEGLTFCRQHDVAALFLQRHAGGFQEHMSPAFQKLLS